MDTVLWVGNVWALGAIAAFLTVALRRHDLAASEEGRAALVTATAVLAMCAAGIARRLGWGVADQAVFFAYVALATVYAFQAWRAVRHRRRHH